MDRQLSLGQYLIITVIVVLINNLALWYFLGSEPEEITNVQTDSIQTPNLIKESKELGDIDIKQNRNSELLAANSDEEEQEQNQEQEIFEDSIEVTSAVKNYMASDEFFEVLDTYRTQRQQKQRELQEEVASLSTLELLHAYSIATDRQEKNIILQALYQSDLTAIDSYQLKEIYNNEDVNDWMKSRLLVAMLDQKDQDSITLAKEFLRESKGQYGYEVWDRLFDFDRGYVIETANELPVDQLVKNSSLVSTLARDSEALKSFFEKQLDNILDADDSRIYRDLQNFGVEMELSRSQEQSLGDLLASERKSKRSFAIGFVGNISDIDMLKDRYADLFSSQEKQTFIYGLISNSASENHKELARELSENSDDPLIKQITTNL